MERVPDAITDRANIQRPASNLYLIHRLEHGSYPGNVWLVSCTFLSRDHVVV